MYGALVVVHACFLVYVLRTERKRGKLADLRRTEMEAHRARGTSMMIGHGAQIEFAKLKTPDATPRDPIHGSQGSQPGAHPDSHSGPHRMASQQPRFSRATRRAHACARGSQGRRRS